MGGFYDRHPACINDHFVFPTEESLERFAKLIASVERSACDQVCGERQWQGLTDEERGQVINANFGTGLWQMAKDIETKLKEKNA